MKVVSDYAEAFKLFTDHPGVVVGVDIGKQFGTRIVMHIGMLMAHKLLHELQNRDLPCPQVIWYNNRILIGADPE